MRSRLVFLLMALMSVVITHAQDEPQVLNYGDTLKVEFPKDAEEMEFEFTGTAGDVIVVEAFVGVDDVLSGLFPDLQLLNDRGSTMADTQQTETLETLDTFKSVIPFDLPSDGTYTVIVTNGAARFGNKLQDDAPFTIRLLKPDVLETDQVVEGATETGLASYYVVISGEPFGVSFHRQSGDYSPALFVDRIENGAQERLAAVYGQSLLSGSVSVEPSRNTVHLISISRAPYDSNIFSRLSLEFTIELTDAQ